MAYRFALWGLSALLVLSCSQEPPVSSLSSAFAEDSGPWQTVSINGATYRRVAAKPTETSQADLLITIPISYTVEGGAVRFSDTVQIAGRTYTADCGTGGGDDVGNTPASATTLLVRYSDSSADDPSVYGSPEYELTEDDVDFFRLEVTRTVELGVGSYGAERSGVNLLGQLLNSREEIIDINDNVSDTNIDFFLYRQTARPGTYYVRVSRGLTGGGQRTGTYTLGVATWIPGTGKPTVAGESGRERQAAVIIEKMSVAKE